MRERESGCVCVFVRERVCVGERVSESETDASMGWLQVVGSSAVCSSVLHCVALCCIVLQCVAVCCSVLQCVTVSWESCNDIIFLPPHTYAHIYIHTYMHTYTYIYT